MTVRVVLVDDQELVRAGFRVLLERDPLIEVVGEAPDGAEAIRVVSELLPDVVLMDIRMPGLDGLTATRALLSHPSTASTRIVVLSTFDDDEYVFEALRLGAVGFLLKDAEPAELRRAVHTVVAGDSLLSPGVTRRVVAHFAEGRTQVSPAADKRTALLTAREREVVKLVAGGHSNRDIAELLNISYATAKTHVSRTLTKTGARDRAQLVIVAYESGLVTR